MPKIPITLTLTWLTLIATTLPHTTYAERVLCATPMECYEKAMEKLQQALEIVKAQQIENKQLQKKVAEMERKNQHLDKKIAQLKKLIAQLKKQIANQVRIRYLDNGNGTVTDYKTGLIWLKNALCFTAYNWKTTMKIAANLADGQCGLRDGSSRGMWRLPTKDEWEAMIDMKYSYPKLSNAAGNAPWTEGDAFLAVQTLYYWSSTTHATKTSDAWLVRIINGIVDTSNKGNPYYVWPVRRRQ